ncbi:hypothetical protein PT300_09020 [Enterobacteriaceae bacterium ESL0689]|nr:hypothetical protein [Enterobacteriaceae bacterium ESL0689]
MSTGYLTPGRALIRPPVSSNVHKLVTRQGGARLALPTTLLPAGIATRPVSTASQTHHNGYLADAWLSRFYNRIRLLPAAISLGAVSSVQTVRVKVWNAWLKSQTLLAVTVSGSDGIRISGPQTPRQFNRLAVYEWEISASRPRSPAPVYG